MTVLALNYYLWELSPPYFFLFKVKKFDGERRISDYVNFFFFTEENEEFLGREIISGER